MNTTIDTTVIALFSTFILFIGLLFARTGRNLKSFFAGGESVPWFIGGLSLFMSFFSAGTFVAWGSIAYQWGWVAVTIQWTMCIGGLVTGLYLAPRWKATGALTAAEFIKDRLGPTVQKIFIYIFLVVSLFIKGSVLYPVARLVSSSLGYPLVPCTIVLGLFMIAYTAVGGLWAVMVTDILQFVVLTAAVVIIVPLSFQAAGGADAFVNNAPEGFFSLTGGEYSSGFILAFAVYHIFQIGGNWAFVQRYTSVESPKSARKVAYLFAALYLISPVIWMLPPMIYKTINPSLQGLEAENAYLMVCKLVLPPGLIGLMLTGMYFSTSASANTTLNVASAVFTNDIYKGMIRPTASDSLLMRVARLSSWVFGLGMIGIALLVPYIGGMVEVVLSIGAITVGPLLAPPIWALVSKRLTGKATLVITLGSLAVNIFFKMILPLITGGKLSRAGEMTLGVGLPVLLLGIFELWASYKDRVSQQYTDYMLARQVQVAAVLPPDPLEMAAVARQNRFGLKVICLSLVFTALLLFILSFFTATGVWLVRGISVVILLLSYIPWHAAAKKSVVPIPAIALLAVMLVGGSAMAQKPAARISNQQYRLSISGQVNVAVERLNAKGVYSSIEPKLCVLYSETDPQFGPGHLPEERTPTAGWKKGGKNYGTDLFAAGEKLLLTATSAKLDEKTRRITFSYAAHPSFTASLQIELLPGNEPPLIQWKLVPLKEGWYSVGFTGLRQNHPDSLDFLYQPLVWQWKRFPQSPCLTTESYATTAATYVNTANKSEGIAPDPSEIPYRYAKFEQSRFGLALRDTAGQASPMLFAPILGGVGSKKMPGESLTFKCRYFLTGGNWYEGLKDVLYSVFHYKNERRNATVSLNTTLENMIDYAMDDFYGGWVDSLKGFDYSWDVLSTVKVVSALHPLSIALTTGNMEIYRRRALPLMEYVMSREKYLYSVHDSITSQNPSHRMMGPCVEIGELAGLHNMTGGKSPVFSNEAERIFGKPRKLNLLTESTGSSWQDWLARYRITGNIADLDKSRAGASEGISSEITSFPTGFSNAAGLRDRKSAFYSDFVPKWNDYLEMYEATKEPKYLDAAVTGAKGLLYWMRSNPMAPDSNILVNKGGKVPGVFEGRRISQEVWETFDTSTELPEQVVPAWQTSLIGITPEQPSTYRVAGPIMLANHAPWMLRLAALAKDTLLRDAAYNAVLGRYANFPGYYFDNLRTNVYQQPGYPLHPYKEMKYNAIFYNHVWPHIALLQDFLVGDAFLRSDGNVDFPSVYAPGYAFLANKVYGSKPGSMYGHKGLSLWLPKAAVKTAEPCYNYLFGIGKNDLFLVLMNTWPTTMRQSIFLDPGQIPWAYGHKYNLEIYDWAGKVTHGTMLNGKLDVKVPANGLVTIRIKGLVIDVPLQRKITDSKTASKTAYIRQPVGSDSAAHIVTGMLLNFTPDFSDAYIYLNGTDKETKKVTLQYKTGQSGWKKITDHSYPFEFSLHLDKPDDQILFTIETESHGGKLARSKELTLGNKD
jgi:SSS family solute:Na+ symporter